jgi:integrase
VPTLEWERLKHELPDDPNALAFPRPRGGLLPIEEYRHAFHRACKRVGIEGLVRHGLRHTTASLASRHALT